MGKTRPPYPPEFRSEAIRLVRNGGLSQSQVSLDLGVSTFTLRNWLRQTEIDAGERGGAQRAQAAAQGEPRPARGTRDPAAESSFSTIKKELIYRQTFKTRNSARLAIFDYIERFYNPVRRHSTLGNKSPVNYEHAATAATT